MSRAAIPEESVVVLIVGAGPGGASAASHLARRGVQVVLVDERPDPPATMCGVDMRAGTQLWGGFREEGKLILGTLQGGQARYLQPRLLVIATGSYEPGPPSHPNDLLAPENMLSRLLGCRHRPDETYAARLLAERDAAGATSQPDIFVIGDAGGIVGAHAAAAQGALAASAIARRLGLEDENTEDPEMAFPQTGTPPPTPLAMPDAASACGCEGVSFGTLRATAAANEIADIASLKRLTRAGMGECQGRFCLPALAEVTGRIRQELDLPAPQNPLRPIPLAAIAVEQAEWRGHARVPLPKARAKTAVRFRQAEGADVVIIGAGIVGLSTALFVARAGRKVVVLDRGQPGAGASGGNAGSLHGQLLSFDHDGASTSPAALTLTLQRDSIALWGELARDLGTDFEMALTGGYMVAETEAEVGLLGEKILVEQANGVGSELIGAEELRRREPALAPDLVGAAYCAQEGKINPLTATAAIARAARTAGAHIVARAELLALARDGDGYRIESSAGTWRAGHVVNAAGAFAAPVARMLGLDIPVHGAPLQMVVTQPSPPLIHALIAHASRHLTLKQSRSGAILIGGGWGATLDPVHGTPRPLRRSLEGNLWVAQRVVPALGALRVVRSWAAMNIDIDGAPILGGHPDQPCFFQAVTSNGFTLGPIAGRITADLILRGKADRDISPYSLARFKNQDRQ